MISVSWLPCMVALYGASVSQMPPLAGVAPCDVGVATERIAGGERSVVLDPVALEAVSTHEAALLDRLVDRIWAQCGNFGTSVPTVRGSDLRRHPPCSPR